MSKKCHPFYRDALEMFAFAFIILAFFLGIGGCCYLASAGTAKETVAKKEITP